jgi:hypothetical protein
MAASLSPSAAAASAMPTHRDLASPRRHPAGVSVSARRPAVERAGRHRGRAGASRLVRWAPREREADAIDAAIEHLPVPGAGLGTRPGRAGRRVTAARWRHSAIMSTLAPPLRSCPASEEGRGAVKSMATMRRVGWVNDLSLALGITTPRGLYEALVPLACGACGQAIAVGERFTRRKLAGGALPACRACAPFDEP